MTITNTMKNILDKSTTPPMKRNLLSVRDQLLNIQVGYRRVFHKQGSLPHFIVIGAQKCGTTYFYDELVKHPDIQPALTKEVRFFDINENYHKGVEWYRGFFPPERTSEELSNKKEFITGEASPCYFFHPHAAYWIKKVVPQAKLILLLRDPVSRAYSHYQHEVRLGFETLSFEDALQREEKRLMGEKEIMQLDEKYFSHRYMHFGYKTWGRYVEYLPVWFDHFPREQILILQSEDFFRDRTGMLRQATQFLDLPDWEPQLNHPKPSRYPKMDQKLKEYLTEYFEPYNRSLYHFLQTDFGWTRIKAPIA